MADAEEIAYLRVQALEERGLDWVEYDTRLLRGAKVCPTPSEDSAVTMGLLLGERLP